MEKNKFITNNLSTVEVLIALCFMIPVWMGIISAKDLIVNILLFIVFIELTRVVINFLSEGNKVGITIRYMVDGAIAFSLRELLIAMTDTHHILAERKEESYFILIILSTLFLLRWISAHFGIKKEERPFNND